MASHVFDTKTVASTAFYSYGKRDWLNLLALVLLYFVAARFGLSLAISTEQVTTIWPPTGIALAALLLLGIKFWPAIFLGAFFANMFANETVWVALGISIGNTLAGVAGLLLLKKFDFRNRLDRLRDVISFVVLACVLSPIVSATIGVTSLALGNLVSSGLEKIWLTWWVGDMMGILLFAPLLLIWSERSNLGIFVLRKWEALALLSALLLSVILIFTRTDNHIPAITYLIFPFLIWAAVRFTQIGAVTANFIIAAVAVNAIIAGSGPFAVSSFVETNLIYFFIYLFVFAVTSLILAAVILERRALEIGLVSREQRYQAMIENSTDGITLIDAQARILYSSKAVTKLLGYTVEEFVGINGFDLMHPEDVSRVKQVFLRLLSNPPGKVEMTEYRYKHKDGHWKWIQAIGNNLLTHFDVQAIVVNYSDINEQKINQEKIQHQLYHDPLTELVNRSFFSDKVSSCITNFKKNKFAVFVIDLDRFKIINDSLGHAFGDRVLKEVASRLKSCTSESCARLGGDEFTILLENIKNEKDAAQLSQKILEAFRAPFKIDKHELFLTVSIGISIYPSDGHDVSTLLQNADAALYRAKEQGRNNYQFYIPSLNPAAYKQLTLENSLRRAIAEKEFVVYYIPQVHSKTGKIINLESLVRWRNPDVGLMFPDEFIPLAENAGLIDDIDEFVLRTAVAQTASWQQAGFPDLGISVNLSSRFFRPKLIALLHEVLSTTGMAPQNLTIEMTERIIVESSIEVLGIIQKIKSMGVKIGIDDFNTGYAAFNYIKRFPFDYLKIGIEFIKGIPHNENDCAIARSIVTLGHSLGKQVIAEGVEKKQQLRYLQDLGVDAIQGYLFSGPVPPESLQEILFRDREFSYIK